MHAVRRVLADGALPAAGAEAVTAATERATVGTAPRRGHGDYALNIAFPLAKAVGRTPREVAPVLRGELLRQPGIARVEITGPGFLDVTLDAGARSALVGELAAGAPEPEADDPASDIASWSAATGDDPRSLAVRDTSSPLFRVQYAHARARALLRGGDELGVTPRSEGEAAYPYDHVRERALLGLLADHRRQLAGSSRAHARHLEAVGEAFFDFHDACPSLPRGDEKPGAVHRARLALAAAAGTVLAGGLSQLGVTAPAHL
nr:arginine--tRNA ligase [Streptomyces sp. HNM0574]